MTATSIHVRVVSKRAGAGAAVAEPSETVIDVDRTHPVLGNTFILRDHNDDAQRERVIAQYGAKLDADLKMGGPMSKALDALADRALKGERLALRCWCAPRPCHADLLRNQIFLKLGMEPEENQTVRPKQKQMGLF